MMCPGLRLYVGARNPLDVTAGFGVGLAAGSLWTSRWATRTTTRPAPDIRSAVVRPSREGLDAGPVRHLEAEHDGVIAAPARFAVTPRG